MLYDGYTIYVTPTTLPTFRELENIIKCAGGRCVGQLQELPVHKKKIIVVSAVTDSTLWPNIKLKFPDAVIIDTEGFMTSILKQKIDFHKKRVIG